MRTTIVWLTLLCLGALSDLQAGPLEHPLRLVNEQRVNLMPLFTWTTNHQGTRPLTAWLHVTGSISNSSAWGWIVQGHIEESLPQKTKAAKEPVAGKTVRILLKNPPTQDLAEFEQLRSQLQALEQEQARATAAENRARNLARAHRNRAAAVQNRQARQAEAELKGELKPLAQQIQALKAKLAAYPHSNHYTVDCLALQTDQLHDGLRVYDHGIILQ